MRPFLATILLLFCFFGAICAQEKEQPPLIHYSGDRGGPVDAGDTTATAIVGNVKFYHNGAVVTCDSAVLFTDDRFHFFGRVVLNQNTSYIYGDKVEYDGERNMARVFAPIVKIVDEDAVLYTYNFTFNTLDNIGRYYGGGTLRQAENHMESNQGFYYADDRLVVGVGEVEMRNPDYKMQSDSVAYDMNTEVARFFSKDKKTHIWTTKGEVIRSRTGQYDNLSATYTLDREAYFYNGNDEMWADSLIYASDDESLWLYDNIQIRNEENFSYLFGDFGQYWGGLQNAVITQNPTALNIDREKSDSIYMNADTLFFYTFPSELLLHKAAEPPVTIVEGEELIAPRQSPEAAHALELLDSLTRSEIPPMPDAELPDSVSVADSTAVEIPPAPLTKREQRLMAVAEKQKAKEAKLEARRQKQAEKDAQILARRMEKMKERGIEAAADSIAVDSVALDSLAVPALSDSLQVAVDSLAVDATPEAEKDSLQRVIKAYYKVKIFGRDMQAVCDSLVGFSADSTTHLYVDPVLWSGANQITAEVIDIYSKDGAIDRALFSGSPIMSAEVEPGAKYNQVKGLTMESFFRSNEIYRHNVISNAETLYYMQDEVTGDYQGFVMAKASTMAFLLDSLQIQDIWMWSQITDAMYPVDQIPETQPTELEGFSWKGDRRPVLEDVFARSIRDSELGMYDSMPQPGFPLTEAILKDRDNKISAGMWVERNDRLAPETIEWIRSVDPDYGKDPEDEINRAGSETMELPAEGAGPAEAEQQQAQEEAPVDIILPDSVGGAEATTEEKLIMEDSVEPAGPAESAEPQEAEVIEFVEEAVVAAESGTDGVVPESGLGPLSSQHN